MSALSPRVPLLAAAVCALALLPAAASAGTVTKSGDTITYQAAAGEDNSLQVTQAGGTITFNENGTVPVVDGGGCPLVAGNAVCPEGGVARLVVNLGDLDDFVVLTTSALPLTATGGPGRDDLNGDSGADTLRGEGGNDSLDGRAGADTLEGGDGNDGADGGDGNDTVSGGPGPDSTLRGGAGNDTVSGDGGSDTSLFGDEGSDAVNGGDGDDAIEADEGADTVSGGAGRDRYNASQQGIDLSITLDDAANDGTSGEGDNIRSDIEDVSGGAGNDTLTGSAATNSLDGQDGNDAISGGAGPENLSGGDGNDALNGDSGGDTLNGGDNEDVLNGGADADLLRAANGSDVLNGGDGGDLMEQSNATGDGPDVFNGGAGSDTVSWRDFELAVAVTLDGAPNDGFAGAGDNVAADVETVVGSAADDVLTGGPGFNVIDGGFGNDTVAIRDGALDVAICGDGSDTVTADGVDSIDPVGGGCESVDRSPVASTGRRIGRTGSATHRRGVVTLTLTCALDALAGCDGRAAMTSSGLGTIGRSAFVMPAGSERTVRISLSKRARARLNSRGRLRVSLRLSGFDLRGALATRTVTFTIRR
jgi:Ca2+-binding RTX toxin-like protein